MALYLSLFEPDPEPARAGAFLASLWQGPVPGDLVLHRWLYLEGDSRSMALLWEGGGEARAWIDQALGGFGALSTTAVTDATGGLAACLERDLDAFGAWMRSRGSSEPEIERALDVRRRGLEAGSPKEAAAAGRDWAAGS